MKSNRLGELAIVVGSGAAKCADSLGMWQSLQREGIHIALAVGASGGSIYKSTFAFYSLVHHTEVILLMPHFRDSIGTYDSNLVSDIVAAGASAMDEQIPYIRRMLAMNAD